jgi:hypothetical protein
MSASFESPTTLMAGQARLRAQPSSPYRRVNLPEPQRIAESSKVFESKQEAERAAATEQLSRPVDQAL